MITRDNLTYEGVGSIPKVTNYKKQHNSKRTKDNKQDIVKQNNKNNNNN